MHKLKRKNYVSPECVVTRVELESPICSGSVEMTAEPGIGTDAQVVNEAFEKNNDFSSQDSSWD